MKGNLYFPALDGLRFLAFLLVLFHHVSFYLGDTSSSIFWTFLSKNGWVGVDIFFVLTGFLITILFLTERKNQSKFAFKDFFIRRSLRILPLYFLAFVAAFFLLPTLFLLIFDKYNLNPGTVEYMKGSLPWYLMLAGNWYVVLNGFGDSRLISILWAVCTDIQFYLVWPFILFFVRNFKTGILISLIIIACSMLYRWYLVNSGVPYPAIYVNTLARLDTFMFGAIIGFLIFYKDNLMGKIKLFYSWPLPILVVILLIVYMYFATLVDRQAIRHSVLGYTITGILSAFIILFCIKSKSFLVSFLNDRIIAFLGRISYGLYIWHILAILLLYYSLPNHLVNLWLPILALPLSVLLAFMSFRFYEKPFLNIRNKFIKI
jgi:peptidoglycan/LPS O-acetylase OafA/YrhL